jgi:starch synthase
VHNLPYQGEGAEAALLSFGLPRAIKSSLPEKAAGTPLPLGLLAADKINTVSPGYASEMLSPEFGAGLEDFLNTRKGDLVGILNGLDVESWDPEIDPHLPVNYNLNSLVDRSKNKLELLKELDLPLDPDIPLICMISRMDHQKGVDLLPDALHQIKALPWQAVILGTGDPTLEAVVRKLDSENPQIRAVLEYAEPLAHRIYGGADLIIIPSRYEPCGLTQMIGMRYGCVPLARATGGLRDTIVDYHSGRIDQQTGFLFIKADSTALADCLRRGLEMYQDQRRWRGLQRRGMNMDFSWSNSANKYFDLYTQILS